MSNRRGRRTIAELEGVSTADMTPAEYRRSDDDKVRTVVAGNARYVVMGKHSADAVAATTGGTIHEGDLT